MNAPTPGADLSTVHLKYVRLPEVLAFVQVGQGTPWRVRGQLKRRRSLWKCDGCPNRRGPHGCTHTLAVERALVTANKLSTPNSNAEPAN